MARIAKEAVHQALQQAADIIMQAGGDDKRISRKDIDAKLEQLSGTQKALVDILYRFIDKRDAAPRAQVTYKDVQKAVDYAKEHLIDNYDLNNNGLSKDEDMFYSGCWKRNSSHTRNLLRSLIHPLGWSIP